MSEFTGERIIPGQVELDLWNEHIARYTFAARFAKGVRALDLGCGTGYGAAALAQTAASVVGVDVSADAVTYAREHFPIPNLRFAQASATAVDAPDASFGLITAFEIIEHIEAWRDMLKEARRLIQNDGVFLVSTPNIRYYAESRGETGPNPFHVHEFSFDEFTAALREFFPVVQMLLQNRTEAFAFHPHRLPWPADAKIDGGAGEVDDAHFFFAVCSVAKPIDARSFIYVPRAANMLREREQHIALLKSELAQNREWLETVQQDHLKLVELHTAQKEQLEEHNRWGLQLEADWKAGLNRIADLQREFQNEQAAARAVVEQYEAKVRELESENDAKTQWACETEQRLGAELESKQQELTSAVEALHSVEEELETRTRHLQQLEAEASRLRATLNFVRESRWVKLGRLFRIGPKVAP